MNRLTKQILQDGFIFLLVLLMMDTAWSGIHWHERIGIAVGVVLVIHTLLHWAWMKAIFQLGKRQRLNRKTRWVVALDIGIGISFAVTVITGLIIARTMPFLSPFSQSAWVTALHHSSAYGALLLTGVHVGVHVHTWRSGITAWYPTLARPSVQTVSRMAAMAVMVFGLRGFWALDYLQVMASPVTGVNPLATVSTLMIDDDQNQLTEASLAGNEGTIQSESLSTYLGRLVCTGCHRHCPLLAPQCQTGVKQAAAATAVYESQTATLDEDGIPASEKDGITNTQVLSPSWWNFPGVTGMMVLGTYYLITWKKKL